MSSFSDPTIHLALLLTSLACLGLWILTFKLQAGRWRFELFAVDFALGTFLFALCAALGLGNFGTDLPFDDRLLVSSKTAQALMVASGLIFAVGNTLLLGAVSLLGVAAAFSIGGGTALAIGAALSYPKGHSGSLLTAAALFIVAALLAMRASRSVEPKAPPPPKGQPLGPIRLRRSTKGILVAVLGGAAIGVCYPLAFRGAFDDFGLGPYAGLFLFCLSVLVTSIVFSLYFFNIALEGGALTLRTYARNWPRKHLAGILGGVVWAAGALAVVLARTSSIGSPIPDRTVYLTLASIPLAIGMGISLFREFAKASASAVFLMVLALLGITAGVITLAFGIPAS